MGRMRAETKEGGAWAGARRHYTGPEFDIRIGPSSLPLACAPVRVYRLPAALKNVARAVVVCEEAFVSGPRPSRSGRVQFGSALVRMQTLELTPETLAAGEIEMVRVDGHPDDTVHYYIIAASGG